MGDSGESDDDSDDDANAEYARAAAHCAVDGAPLRPGSGARGALAGDCATRSRQRVLRDRPLSTPRLRQPTARPCAAAAAAAAGASVAAAAATSAARSKQRLLRRRVVPPSDNNPPGQSAASEGGGDAAPQQRTAAPTADLTLQPFQRQARVRSARHACAALRGRHRALRVWPARPCAAAGARGAARLARRRY